MDKEPKTKAPYEEKNNICVLMRFSLQPPGASAPYQGFTLYAAPLENGSFSASDTTLLCKSVMSAYAVEVSESWKKQPGVFGEQGAPEVGFYTDGKFEDHLLFTSLDEFYSAFKAECVSQEFAQNLLRSLGDESAIRRWEEEHVFEYGCSPQIQRVRTLSIRQLIDAVKPLLGHFAEDKDISELLEALAAPDADERHAEEFDIAITDAGALDEVQPGSPEAATFKALFDRFGYEWEPPGAFDRDTDDEDDEDEDLDDEDEDLDDEDDEDDEDEE